MANDRRLVAAIRPMHKTEQIIVEKELETQNSQVTSKIIKVNHILAKVET